MFPEEGEKLGPYEILGQLGGGGMARVYRAWDGRLHREVAIKVIDNRLSMPGIGERFLLEARAASGLNHPNICTIFDIGEQDGAPYLVMELLEGETLRERLRDQDVLSVEEILRFSAEVSDALAAAHARGIVHRDVKPANIFLVRKPNGSVQSKMLDFGLAKIEQYANVEREFSSNLTSMGATVGTVSYMSPEQARGEKLDARSDLFSLGIVMYEMATGLLPFRGNTSALVFVQLLGQMSPEPIRRLNGEIPADLERVIMKLLSKSARGRYQSAAELTDQLQDLAEGRSGWLARLRTPPSDAVQPESTDSLGQPAYRQRPSVAAPSSKLHSSADVDRSHAARVSNRQDAYVPGRQLGSSMEDEARLKRAQARRDAGSGQMPAGQSGIHSRQMRTSIATNPKISYPSTAPYVGKSGNHRAQSTLVEESGVRRTRAEEVARTAAGWGFSGMKPLPRSPKDLGVPSESKPEAAPLAMPNEEEVRQAWLRMSKPAERAGLDWKWIVLIIAIILLVAGLLAWRFGWLSGALPMHSSAILFTHRRTFLQRR